MNRKGLDFSFTWIFAIIAWAVILFSAIYITTQLIGSAEIERDSFVSAELSNILSPVETNLEDNKYSLIKFNLDTRVYNECSNSGVFGKQEISTASKSSGGWSDQSVSKSSFNRYIFSRGIEETNNKKMHILTNPLDMPFKMGDVMILHGGKYCFVNPSDNVEDIFTDLSSNGAQDIGVNISSRVDSCPKNYTTVCFNANGCDIKVITRDGEGTVSKYGRELIYYGDALQLAAIFSDPEVYECQIKRLAKRAGELGVIYKNKALYVEGSGCSNNLVSDLQSFVLATNVTGSRDFGRIAQIAKSLEEKNDGLGKCKIF